MNTLRNVMIIFLVECIIILLGVCIYKMKQPSQVQAEVGLTIHSIKDAQRQLGCKKIDGIIGKETIEAFYSWQDGQDFKALQEAGKNHHQEPLTIIEVKDVTD